MKNIQKYELKNLKMKVVGVNDNITLFELLYENEVIFHRCFPQGIKVNELVSIYNDWLDSEVDLNVLNLNERNYIKEIMKPLDIIVVGLKKVSTSTDKSTDKVVLIGANASIIISLPPVGYLNSYLQFNKLPANVYFSLEELGIQ